MTHLFEYSHDTDLLLPKYSNVYDVDNFVWNVKTTEYDLCRSWFKSEMHVVFRLKNKNQSSANFDSKKKLEEFTILIGFMEKQIF